MPEKKTTRVTAMAESREEAGEDDESSGNNGIKLRAGEDNESRGNGGIELRVRTLSLMFPFFFF